MELLEAILLYYKDFVHNVNDLLINARQLHKYGFGICQSSKASLVDGADILQQHIGLAHIILTHIHTSTLLPPGPSHTLYSHLGSLILVESFDLDSILTNLDDQRYECMGMGSMHFNCLHSILVHLQIIIYSSLIPVPVSRYYRMIQFSVCISYHSCPI